jgi:hypothetical protein
MRWYENARRKGQLGSRERVPSVPRRIRVRVRIRRGAQVTRNAPLSGRAHLDQSDLLIHRRARARAAKELLNVRRASSARGHHRHCHRAGRRWTVCDHKAGGRRGQGHQDRTSRRRFRARVRFRGQWTVEPFRMAEAELTLTAITCRRAFMILAGIPFDETRGAGSTVIDITTPADTMVATGLGYSSPSTSRIQKPVASEEKS